MDSVSKLEFTHVQSFLVLSEELHFGRAATRLFISQPAMSHRIRRLEAALGVPLVSRRPAPVRLTPAGERFAHAAQHLWDEATTCVSSVQEPAGLVRGPLEGQEGPVAARPPTGDSRIETAIDKSNHA